MWPSAASPFLPAVAPSSSGPEAFGRVDLRKAMSSGSGLLFRLTVLATLVPAALEPSGLALRSLLLEALEGEALEGEALEAEASGLEATVGEGLMPGAKAASISRMIVFCLSSKESSEACSRYWRCWLKVSGGIHNWR